jgi:hypothetical protein
MTPSARKMVLYPFVITKQNDANDGGVPLVSVARGHYIYQDKTLKNTSVVVTNIKAINVQSWDVQCLAALFNHSTFDTKDNIINWEQLLQKNLPLTDNNDLLLFLDKHKFPKISSKNQFNLRLI